MNGGYIQVYKTHLIMVYPETYTTSGLQGDTSHDIYRNIYPFDIKSGIKRRLNPCGIYCWYIVSIYFTGLLVYILHLFYLVY